MKEKVGKIKRATVSGVGGSKERGRGRKEGRGCGGVVSRNAERVVNVFSPIFPSPFLFSSFSSYSLLGMNKYRFDFRTRIECSEERGIESRKSRQGDKFVQRRKVNVTKRRKFLPGKEETAGRRTRRNRESEKSRNRERGKKRTFFSLPFHDFITLIVSVLGVRKE